MGNRRRLNLEKYGISQQRYAEMRAFCLQYPEWQAALRDIRNITAVNTSNEAVQSGSVGNTTESAAIRALQYSKKIDAVERALKTVVGDEKNIYEPMLRSLTHGIRYDNLDIPVSRDTYFQYRTAFFVNLDKVLFGVFTNCS